MSIAARAASRREGTSRYCRFLLPQSVRKLITFLSALTASTTSCFSSVPDSSSSIIWKTSRAAFKNSSVNSASARSAAREVFQMIDKDDSGTLDKAEIVDAVRPRVRREGAFDSPLSALPPVQRPPSPEMLS